LEDSLRVLSFCDCDQRNLLGAVKLRVWVMSSIIDTDKSLRIESVAGRGIGGMDFALRLSYMLCDYCFGPAVG